MKAIGIIGGMGPEASALFYQMIIDVCRKKYNAIQDIDYPPIFICSIPLYGFDETGIIEEKLILRQLLQGIRKLEQAKSDFVVIACNTVHYFIEELRKNAKIPILSIVEETLQKLKSEGVTKIGLLASESAYRLKTYNGVFDKHKIEVVIPSKTGQKVITKVILNVMAGNSSEKDKEILLSLIDKMKNRHVEAIVLGCTEIPLVFDGKHSPLKAFNTLEILAESAVERSRR